MPRPVHFEIHATDPGVVRQFYGELFGWTFQQWGEQPYWLISTGEADAMAGAASSQPGIDGGLVSRVGPPAESGQPVNAWVVTVDVPDARAYLERALALGGTVAVPLDAVPGVGWLAYFKDPDGNIVGLMQADPQAAPAQ